MRMAEAMRREDICNIYVSESEILGPVAYFSDIEN